MHERPFLTSILEINHPSEERRRWVDEDTAVDEGCERENLESGGLEDGHRTNKRQDFALCGDNPMME